MSDRTIGDTAPPLTGTVSADITNAEWLRAHVVRPDRTVFTLDADPVDADAGTWTADFDADSLVAAGRHDVELEVKFSNGKIQTFSQDPQGSQVSFMVRDQFA